MKMNEVSEDRYLRKVIERGVLLHMRLFPTKNNFGNRQVFFLPELKTSRIC